MTNEQLSDLALRVFRAEENLHLAQSRNLTVRILKRRERAVVDAMAKLTPEQLQAQRDRKARMNGAVR
jgi:hypothetical protein